ncbi:uroporphyrinogen decarboxylase [Chlamydiales bacterium]|nr:uroporphyrinogen decarboxylase [Chlamydiales bacterium]
MSHSHFLSALKGENKLRPPVWLMRQAGRYLPEYQAMRKKYPFLEMCHTPELVKEVTMMPIKRFSFDAAILFSDILMIPEALNLGLRFEDGVGPIMDRPITSKEQIDSLPDIEMSVFSFIQEAIGLLKKELKVPLIGFAGAPFTVASYMVPKAKQFYLKNPEAFKKLLDRLTDITIDYLHIQVKAGVDAIQIFDSHLNLLSPKDVQEFSYPYLERIFKAFPHVSTILFSKGSHWPQLGHLPSKGLSCDWTQNLSEVRKAFPKKVIQGNLDPEILFAPKERVAQYVKECVEQMGGDPAYIFNLGHGILPNTPLESVETLIKTIDDLAFARSL